MGISLLMGRTETIRRGDILLAHYPFTDQTASKLRPVLVVSLDKFNTAEDLVVVPISSVADPLSHLVVALPDSDPSFRNTGLRYSSYVKWTKPLVISRKVVDKKIGALPKELVDLVASKIAQLVGFSTESR